MKEPCLQKQFPALGTVHCITVYGKHSAAAAELVKARILELHRHWSVFDPDSEISALNCAAGLRPVAVSKDTLAVLNLAVQCAAETNGAFDITAGALSRLWRSAICERRMPSAQQIRQGRRLCGINDLVLNEKEQTAFLRRKGMSVDLGGIAKGFAADEAQRILTSCGVERAMLNLGGTVFPMGRPAVVGIQDPFQTTGTALGSLLVQGQAAVTSGSNERCFLFEGKRYHHIADPRTGWPADAALAAVTLLGTNAALLDALATGAFILGASNSLPLFKKHNIEAVFVTDSGSVQITPGLQGRFSLHPCSQKERTTP